MLDSRRISIVIPTYRRPEMTLSSFLKVYNDERVHSIVIVDDCSPDGSYEELQELTSLMPKVKIYRNDTNVDCYKNKRIAVGYSSTDFCIQLDSDNEIDESYIDKIFSLKWDDNCIFTPSWAKPHFDFRAYEGVTISKHNVSQYVDKPMFEVCLNAANYFVNKNKYIETWSDEVDPVTSDSIFFVSKWLERRGEIFIVPGLHYEHRVGTHTEERSHYQKNVSRTPNGFHESILNKLRGFK